MKTTPHSDKARLLNFSAFLVSLAVSYLVDPPSSSDLTNERRSSLSIEAACLAVMLENSCIMEMVAQVIPDSL